MLEVYLDPATVNSRKVLAGLDLLGTEYHLNHVKYFTQEHKKTEYLKINRKSSLTTVLVGDSHGSGTLPRSMTMIAKSSQGYILQPDHAGPGHSLFAQNALPCSVLMLEQLANGTLPAAVDGTVHITESNAILQYAADLSG